MSDSGLPLNLNSLWFIRRFQYYVTGSGIYKKMRIQDLSPWQAIYPGVSSYHMNLVRGNDINDIFLAGAFGEVLHFNGTSWKSYHQQTVIGNGSFWGLSVKGNIIVAVGDEGYRAISTIGRRN